MIYIQENGFKRQLELLAIIAGIDSCKLIAWIYPESRIKHIVGLLISKHSYDYMPVTAYEPEIKPTCTDKVTADPEFILGLKPYLIKFKRNCDSLALYPSGSKDWVACSVGHEGMCLVKDDSLISAIQGAGFSATLEKPVWW